MEIIGFKHKGYCGTVKHSPCNNHLYVLSHSLPYIGHISLNYIYPKISR